MVKKPFVSFFRTAAASGTLANLSCSRRNSSTAVSNSSATSSSSTVYSKICRRDPFSADTSSFSLETICASSLDKRARYIFSMRSLSRFGEAPTISVSRFSVSSIFFIISSSIRTSPLSFWPAFLTAIAIFPISEKRFFSSMIMMRKMRPSHSP